MPSCATSMRWLLLALYLEATDKMLPEEKDHTKRRALMNPSHQVEKDLIKGEASLELIYLEVSNISNSLNKNSQREAADE